MYVSFICGMKIEKKKKLLDGKFITLQNTIEMNKSCDQ